MKEARLQTLGRVPILAGLSRRQLRRLVARTSEHEYSEGAAIVRQGTRGETVFVLLEGTARVVRGGRTVTRLSPGDFFGEIAVLDRRPRTADVLAAEPVKVLVLHRDDLKAILEDEPQAAWALLEALAGRLRGD
jgi:CRP/FNR family transcriptional regulator, cyclic AMP receptor protein